MKPRVKAFKNRYLLVHIADGIYRYHKIGEVYPSKSVQPGLTVPVGSYLKA